MRTRQSRSCWNGLVLAVLLGAATVVGTAGVTARAADDDEEIQLPSTKIFNGLMKGLGLKRGGEIEYRERPALVLPTTKDLPPPEANSPTSKVANWPVDADITRAKKKKGERKFSNPEPDDAGRPLLPNQYQRPGSGSPSSRPNGPTKTAEDHERAMSPSELGSKGIFTRWWSPKEEYSTFTTEPVRESLIEPPAGYRTPSPDQPYGVGTQTWATKAATPDQKHQEAGRN